MSSSAGRVGKLVIDVHSSKKAMHVCKRSGETRGCLFEGKKMMTSQLGWDFSLKCRSDTNTVQSVPERQ